MGPDSDVNAVLPRRLYLETTNHCNAACTMCPREKLTRAKGVMTLEAFRKLIDQLRGTPLLSISLAGFGEPFIDRTLVEKVRYAKQAGVPTVSINTNLSLLTGPLRQELLSSGLDELSVSFYGITGKDYETVMKGLQFKASAKIFHELLNDRKRLSHRGPRIVCRGLGWFNYLLQKDHRWGTHFAARFFYPYLGLRRILGRKFVPSWHNFGVGRKYNAVDTSGTIRRSCKFIEDGTLTVLWNGDVVTCCRDFDGTVTFGNAFEEGVISVWNKESYRHFREAIHLGNSEAFPKCHGCDTLKPKVSFSEKIRDWKCFRRIATSERHKESKENSLLVLN